MVINSRSRLIQFQLAIANYLAKTNSGRTASAVSSLDNDRLGKLFIDVVAAVLDGDRAASSAAGYHGDGFTAVATQREQKSVQILIVCFNALDDVLLAQFCSF